MVNLAVESERGLSGGTDAPRQRQCMCVRECILCHSHKNVSGGPPFSDLVPIMLVGVGLTREQQRDRTESNHWEAGRTGFRQSSQALWSGVKAFRYRGSDRAGARGGF